jgi:hypothetical protein
MIGAVIRMRRRITTGQKMVGAVRFELTTSCTRTKRATRLRYAPIHEAAQSAGCPGELQ